MFKTLPKMFNSFTFKWNMLYMQSDFLFSCEKGLKNRKQIVLGATMV